MSTLLVRLLGLHPQPGFSMLSTYVSLSSLKQVSLKVLSPTQSNLQVQPLQRFTLFNSQTRITATLFQLTPANLPMEHRVPPGLR
jgi:hypothetical protein